MGPKQMPTPDAHLAGQWRGDFRIQEQAKRSPRRSRRLAIGEAHERRGRHRAMGLRSRGVGLVAVCGRLVGAADGDADVVGLLLGKLGEVGAELAEVELGDLLVELLGEEVHLVGVLHLRLVLARLVVRLAQLELGEGLVGERVGHDEGRVAQPRLSRRPSARTMTPWPSGKVYLSHCGLMFMRVVAFSSASIWISLSKWPMLPTMALFFIFFMCSSVMMSLLPVVVMKTSAVEMTSSIVTTW